MSSRAFVTLLTSDSYLAGALTAIHSVLDAEGVQLRRAFETVCLVTPATVSQAAIKALERTFDRVIGVEEITTESWSELDLLGRRDLAATLTKLHLFRLTQYAKVIFLDADTLVLRPLSPLFDDPHPLSAAPDSGWPDAFNSGMMVAKPSEETFAGLIKMMGERGSWDGGDQGLLNDYFPDWNRLSFVYNVTPSAYYTYAPAYQRHGDDVAVLHFIGRDKPWSRGSRAVYYPEAGENNYHILVGKWYDVFERHFGMGLTVDVASRVMAPPSSFKSTYSTLARHAGSVAAIPIPNAAPTPHVVWDPARSSPPRNSTDLQMRDAVTVQYENAWDASKSRQRQIHFEIPTSYPVVPSSTHEWYKDVMAKAPDPSAVQRIFPWEQRAQEPKRSFPREEERIQPAPSQPLYSSVTTTQSGFVNAWDLDPEITRHTRSLSRKASRSSLQGAQGTDTMGGRTSSLIELDSHRKDDQSSMDGDDEDETGSSDGEGIDRAKIKFRNRGSSTGSGGGQISPAVMRSRTGSDAASKGASGSSSSEGSHPPPRRTPPSPRGNRNAPLPQDRSSSERSESGNSFSGQPQYSQGLGLTTAEPQPHAHAYSQPQPSQSQPSSSYAPRKSPNVPTSSLPSISPGSTPRLSSNTRIPPAVVAPVEARRATRVFSAATDPGVVKQQGLAALQRFVENMEAENAAAAASPGVPRTGGGQGTHGSFRP